VIELLIVVLPESNERLILERMTVPVIGDAAD
jgi:hypothetical protein